METLYPVLRFLHVMAFVFMSIPLFNLIVVNERAALGTTFDPSADRYMENIIRRGALRCFAFQATVFVTGILLLVSGPLGVPALWNNGILLAKMLTLILLTVLLSTVHLRVQPRIDAVLATLTPGEKPPEDILGRLRPHRVIRKRLATICLFLVIATIVLGMQVFARWHPAATATVLAFAAMFSWRVNRSLILFGWL